MKQLIRGFNILFYLTWIITQPIIHMSPSLIIICEHPNYPEVNTNNSAFCVNLFQKRDFIYLLLYVSVIFINVVCLSIFVAILIYRKHPRMLVLVSNNYCCATPSSGKPSFDAPRKGQTTRGGELGWCNTNYKQLMALHRVAKQ